MNTRTFVLAWAVLGCVALGGVIQAGEVSPAELIGGLKAPTETARLQAIDQLGACGEKAAAAVAPLAELLKDGSAKVRAHAVWALGAIGEPAKTVAPAMVLLVKDPDSTVRRQAVKSLMTIRPGPQVMVPLCVKLLEDPDPAVRARVLSAIADAGAPAVPGLIEALKSEKAAYWAIIVLREIGPAAKDAVPALVEKLKDSRPEIRREAALTLGAMGEAGASVAPQVAELLKDEHARMAATFALGQLGRIPDQADATIRANAKSDDRLLKTVSLWTLTRAHPEDKDLRRQATEQLIDHLKDKDAFTRTVAARALAALPPAPEITAPIWEKALQGADETTLRYALDALATLGAPAVPRLIEGLKHERARAEVAYILGRIGPPAAPATDALAKLIEDKNARVAGEAILALGAIGPGAKAAVPALIQALQRDGDKDSNFTSIVCALGKIGPDAAAARPTLIGLLKNADHSLALMSVWALDRIEPKSAESAALAVPVLIEGLTLPLAESRLLAAEELTVLGPAAAAAKTALEKASADSDSDVRAAVAKALEAIGGTAAPKLSKVLAEPSRPIAAGDFVVTTDDAVSLKIGTTVVAPLAKGSRLLVIEVRAPWLAVQATISGAPKTGWVLQSQVGKP